MSNSKLFLFVISSKARNLLYSSTYAILIGSSIHIERQAIIKKKATCEQMALGKEIN